MRRKALLRGIRQAPSPRRSSRSFSILASLLTIGLIAGLFPAVPFSSAQVGANGLFPWQLDDGQPAGAAPIGTGFVLDFGDLSFILDQIKIAEQHAATYSALDPCGTLIGTGPNQIPAGVNAELQPLGLRTISGVCNNLLPGQETFGAADQPFPRLAPAYFRDAEPSTLAPADDLNGPAFPNLGDPTSYTQVTGWVEDSEPRLISNLIVDQTINNPAAVAAAGGAAVPGDIDGDGTVGNHSLENCPGVTPVEQRRCDTFYIEPVAPDLGLSPPYSQMLNLFGQFFDHGLDITTKTGDLVYMPLGTDDPLYDPTPGAPNFMLMARATNAAGEPVNLTTPYVDQQQTYGSTPSQHIFLREYALDLSGKPVSTGQMNEGVAGGMSTWADLKAQAATLLGIQLIDEDVLAIPMIASDPYGRFVPGPNGYPQIVLDNGTLLEGDPLAVVDPDGPGGPLPAGQGIPVPKGLAPGAGNGVMTGHAFLFDIAHHAVPGGTCDHDNDGGAVTPEIPRFPDLDVGPEGPLGDDNDPCTWDDEMLGAHFMAGDGRVNENIGLTSVHHVFHAEHNRLVQHVKDQVTALNGGVLLPEFELAPGIWDGERLLQAARFVTEMEYQHLAFEEFARTIQPMVNAFAGYDPSIDAAISAEFAHAVYRFGHSLLTESIDRYDTVTGTPEHMLLFDAFLNPPAFLMAGTKTPEEAAGGIIGGAVAQPGNELDEFVTDALRNALVGLPLDLAAINIARGRDAGIPPLNRFRRAIFTQTNNTAMAPYTSWMDYFLALNTPESLVNFIAAYGTHSFITTHDDGSGAGSVSSRREAADIIVNQTLHPSRPADADDFLWSTGAWASLPSGITTTGLDDVDLWIGGLAEKVEQFGGLLGSTHNYVFELQMENLQDGDRFYYLHRTAGTNLLTLLEGNSFAELIERNTTLTKLPANVFSVPTYTFDLEIVNPGGPGVPLVDNPATAYDETTLLIKMPDGTVRYPDNEPVSFLGRSIADRIHGGQDDDTIRGNDSDDILEGDAGNDAIIGGAGNDIITDLFGDDDLKGGPGNDVISGGPGFDLLQGGSDHDLIIMGADPGEALSGSGNDLVIGGDSADVIFGDTGDDWLEGGGQADLVQGDQGAPFLNNPVGTDGHDVLDGGGGSDDYDSEGGDDILKAGFGTERFEGNFGFDWVVHKGSPEIADHDLLKTGLLLPDAAGVIDRFDLVEGLSGWDGDDTLRGDHRGISLFLDCIVATTCGPLLNNELDAAGIARISGLADILPPGSTMFNAGNIILGGRGSDLMEGRGANDIIDGDRWLNVVLDAPDPLGGPGARKEADTLSELQNDLLNGLYTAGDVNIVRRIEPGAPGTDVDVAVFYGPMGDYNVTHAGDHYIVDHARGCGDPSRRDFCQQQPNGKRGVDDGTDSVFNVETLRFADQDLDISVPPGTGTLRVTTAPAVPAQISLNGIPMDSWGLTWPEVFEGTHILCFSDVEGWIAPACQNIVVTAGLTTTITGTYLPAGQLRVETSPPVPATITVDGEPMDDWGFWTDLPEATYTLCFGPVAGYDAPPCQAVVVAQGAPQHIIGGYTVNPAAVGPVGQGFLRVTSTPALPTQISVDGTVNNRWGLAWMKLPPGTHDVCWGDVEGYTTPACQIVTIVAGQTTVVDGSFTQNGFLQVNTSVPTASTISVNGVARNAWGMWTHLIPGTYEVCFTEVNLHTPPCQMATVNPGALTIVTGGGW